MYCLPVKAGDRGRLNEDEIASQVLHVLNEAPCLSKKAAQIGILTAEPRQRWAKDRKLLLLEEQNSRNIELIEQALVVICIDEPIPLTFNARGFNGSPAGAHYCGGRDESNMAQEMIHGGGSEYNSGNRWFDKTMQLIICNDGTWGLCYEHSPSEGIAVVQLLEGIYKKIDEMPAKDETGSQDHLPPPERLEWIVRPEIDQRIREASRNVDKYGGWLIRVYGRHNFNFILETSRISTFTCIGIGHSERISSRPAKLAPTCSSSWHYS